MILDRTVLVDDVPARASIGPVGRNIASGRFETYMTTTRFMVTRFRAIAVGCLVDDSEDKYLVSYVAKFRRHAEALLLQINSPAVEVLRLGEAGENAKGDPVPASWTAVETVPGHLEHVSGSESYNGQLLLQSTELLLTVQMTADVRHADRVVVAGGRYKVDDINKTVRPGLQVIQLSTDRRA